MIVTKIPSYPANSTPDVRKLLDSIVGFDQFDDWLPDVAYYRDLQSFPDKFVQGINQLFRRGKPSSLETTAPILLEVPRESGSTLSCLALPLDARVCAHSIILAFAARGASGALQRDKVFGFRCDPGQVPHFSRPGAELDEAINQAFQVSDESYVLDVNGFNRSARWTSLRQILIDLGIRPKDELRCLDELLTLEDGSLPSVDDALGFLYNFYLRTVDEELFRARINFVRYRDEYFVFRQESADALTRQLSNVGLTASLSLHVNPRDASDSCPRTRHESAEFSLGRAAYGTLGGECDCVSWVGEDDCTDGYEIAYRYDLDGNLGVSKLVDGASRLAKDAVKSLPILRQVHRVRANAALGDPLDGDLTTAFKQYRKAVRGSRDGVRECLAEAERRGDAWTASWACRLLSDLGDLPSEDLELLKRVALSETVGPARHDAIVALARSTRMHPDEFWRQPAPSWTQHEERSALVAADLLRRRGNEAPWASLGSVGDRYPELVAELEI